MRGFGEIEFVQSVIPEWADPIFIIITTLGSVGMMIGISAAIYWYGDRDRGLIVYSTILVGLAVTFSLKAFIGAPRPPGGLSVVEIQTAAFPSGHAVGATVIYGIIAMTFREIGSKWSRAVSAGILIIAISFSRIVLGVHYLVDVVAGIFFGLIVLIAVLKLSSVPKIFTLAAFISGIGILLSISSDPLNRCLGVVCMDPLSTMVFGATIGSILVYSGLKIPPHPWPTDWRGIGVALSIGVPVFLGIAVFELYLIPFPLLVIASLVGGGIFIAMPSIVGSVLKNF